MLRSLVRWKFVDRTWTATDLYDLAEFWLHVYDEAAYSHKSAESQQILELHLTGFPRSAATVASNELARRLSEAGISVDVSADDPDELVAKTKPRDGNRRPFAGLGIPALASAPFDGMPVEIRYTVADAGATEQGPGLTGATLVVVGELRKGAVAVKSVWADPAFVRIESNWDTGTVWEERVLQAFDKYRARKKVNGLLAGRLFRRLFQPPPPKYEIAFQRCWWWFVDVPLGRPRRGGLLLRSAILFGLCSLPVFLMVLGAIRKEPFWLLPATVLGVVIFLLISHFVSLECTRLNTESEWRDWYDALFRRPACYEAVPPDANTPWRGDPTIRKLTAELVEAGFVHAADITTIPTESAIEFHRMFHAPDGTTYLTLAFTFAGGSGTARWCVWPAKNTSILCQTFFSASTRFETSNFEHPLHTLRREVPTCRPLVVQATTQPVELYQIHVKAVAEWVAEERITCVRHEPVDRVIARQEKISREECRIYHQHPYSARDHRRWYLQLDTRPRPADDGK